MMSFLALRQTQRTYGACFDTEGILTHFIHPETQGVRDGDAIAAAQSVPQSSSQPANSQPKVMVCDRSHWGVLCLSDEDRARFLHNQSTNDILSLKPGQGCETVFVTSTARTLDLATAYILEDAIWVITSPQRTQFLLETLDRYIFFADRVVVQNLSDAWMCWSLVGTDALVLIQSLEGLFPEDAPLHSHQTMNYQGHTLRLAVGSGLGLPGYTLLVPEAIAAPLWAQLCDAGAIPCGQQAWETLRIHQGRPAPDAELTDDYNPLEAGLWQTISFSKGCYIGQETIARLNTYNGVKQRLWGLKSLVPIEVGELLYIDDDKVGRLTSIQPTSTGWFGLAYVRTKAGEAGSQVKVGGSVAELIALPYVSHPRAEEPDGG